MIFSKNAVFCCNRRFSVTKQSNFIGVLFAFGKWCSQMSPCDIERAIASALPTATCGYVGDPNGAPPPQNTDHSR